MQITAPNLAYFFTQMETSYDVAYNEAAVDSWIDRIATEYPVTGEQWASVWMGMLDKLRVWQGPRIVKTPAPQTYFVPIQPFELTEAVDKFKLQDDLYGVYFPIAARMGVQSRKWPDYQMRDLIRGIGFWTGSYQNGTDGLTHWNSAHLVDYWDASKGTYTNDYGPSGTSINGITVGGAFGTNAFNTVWQDMSSRKSESGEAIGAKPDLTMGPSQLRAAMTTVLQSSYYAPPAMGAMTGFVGSMENPLKGWTELFINDDFDTDPVAWYMFCTKKGIKPFSWLLREAPIFTPIVDPTNPIVFATHTHQFGVEARGAPAFGLPWMSSRSGV